MLELFFDILIYTIPQATGRAVVYVFSLGRASCDDGVAEVIGVVFLIAACVLAGVLWARF